MKKVIAASNDKVPVNIENKIVLDLSGQEASKEELSVHVKDL